MSKTPKLLQTGAEAESAQNAAPDAAVAPAAPEATAAHEAEQGQKPYYKTIKSFVVRAGRVTTGQQAALDELSDQFIIPYQEQPLDLAAAFGRQAPTILEIGFGMGEATAHIAKARPDENFLCCEVHTPGVGALLKRIRDEGITNIRIVQHDAVEVLKHMLTPAMLAGAHIYFPDPWHKKRHNKRRLIQAPLVQLLATRLQTGGYLHCATDWQPYAEQMVEVLSAEALLRQNPQASLDGFSEKPWYRPLTKFENRGIRLGHGVWDVVFTRNDQA